VYLKVFTENLDFFNLGRGKKVNVKKQYLSNNYSLLHGKTETTQDPSYGGLFFFFFVTIELQVSLICKLVEF